jgi:hypothetical protein
MSKSLFLFSFNTLSLIKLTNVAIEFCHGFDGIKGSPSPNYVPTEAPEVTLMFLLLVRNTLML